ncbi:hypothetical protein QNO07_04530 [Streptomyces sp. 549]|uniref:hypothetical protein n=1 Tax=Streptomyces sp. 549 TaxID=3049076 RepID=UPI0024C3D8AD|nr:hypothetical protein [Streptomyces sp. 549]MDK1472698.1 hypothetical protein [Streptomyces sp. 549]
MSPHRTPHPAPRQPARAPRSLRAAGAAALAAVALTGCGIRATAVPVDAGAAPSRVACALRGDDAGSDTGTATRVSLVCSSRVVDVERRLDLPSDGDPASRTALARVLLAELRREPGPQERQFGFATAVPDDLRVVGPADGDPRTALRLNRVPRELPGFALAQIVCTYADSALADADSRVVLGGPAGDTGEPLRRFGCSAELRTTEQAADGAGAPL